MSATTLTFERNMFRVRGDTIELWPAYWASSAIRVEYFGDEIDRISEINPVTGEVIRRLISIPVWPASHYVTTKEKMARGDLRDPQGVRRAREILRPTTASCSRRSASVSATNYDIEMMQELGYCSGIENYSRIISEPCAGQRPDDPAGLFPEGFSAVRRREPCDASAGAGDVQWRPGTEGKSLIDFGFRLPSAYDNRPLTFDEFQQPYRAGYLRLGHARRL